MSLTRNEWLEMWASIVLIEKKISQIPYFGASPYQIDIQRGIETAIIRETDKIKKQIESVIGQME